MKNKVAIIGTGNVGTSIAQLIAFHGIADIVLFDIIRDMPQGKALDLSEACPLWNSVSNITGTSEYIDIAGSDTVVITAGVARMSGMSRDDLLHTNAGIIKCASIEIAKQCPDAKIIVVTNPMDALSQLAWVSTGFSSNRVMGMGGVLDSARLRTFIAWELGISPENVETIILGGHGDTMVPMTRFTTVRGIPVTKLIPSEKIESLIESTRNAGSDIVSLLKSGSAYYAPAAATFSMIKAIIFDEKSLLPVACYLDGEYGEKDIYVGVPAIIGKTGVEKIIELDLNEQEKKGFEQSINAVRELLKKIGIR